MGGKSAIATVIVIGLFVFSPMFSLRLDPNRYEGGRSRNIQYRVIRNSSSVAVMLGEFRTSISDILFIKTERYLHSGVGYVPHLEEELAELSREGREGEELEHDEHADVETIILTPEKDFRGIVGELHRRVKPWKDPGEAHEHSGGEEMLPWYRMMTLADPHSVRGYTLGAWWLKYKNIDEAIRFAREGVKNNPEAFQIYSSLAQMYHQKAKNLDDPENPETLEEAKEYYEKSRETYRKAANLALQQRPPAWPEVEEHPYWSDLVENDAKAACRFTVFTEKFYGDPRQALQLAEQFSKVFPDDAPLQRVTAELQQELSGG